MVRYSIFIGVQDYQVLKAKDSYSRAIYRLMSSYRVLQGVKIWRFSLHHESSFLHMVMAVVKFLEKMASTMQYGRLDFFLPYIAGENVVHS